MHLVWVFVLLFAGHLSSAESTQHTFFPGQELYAKYHHSGWSVGSAWEIDMQSNNTGGCLTYGPYSSLFSDSVGPYRVDFSLLSSGYTGDVSVDVYDAANDHILSQRRTTVMDTVSLAFSNTRLSASLEFRVFYSGNTTGSLKHLQTTVRLADQGPFGKFWNKQSHFEFISKNLFNTTGKAGGGGANVGYYFVPWSNGTWYLFHREYFYQPKPSYCKADYARIVVTTSNDEGRTWTPEVPIIANVPNSPTECAVVDGAAFYDAEVNRWHYLGQCLSRKQRWNMCHFYRDGSSPLGPFIPNTHNPVVVGGQLFSKICSGKGKHCPPTTRDEGTPDIVLKDHSGSFIVTFHGFDYVSHVGVRGVASTKDFVHWEVSGGNLPNDVIYSLYDCRNHHWNISYKAPGCIGGGEGTIIVSGDYFYQLIESPDVTLECLPKGQWWPLGLVRTLAPHWAPSPQWEQFSVEPAVMPTGHHGCFIQYQRLFYDADRGAVYFEMWVDDPAPNGWMQIWKLVPGPGKLPIIATKPPA